MDEVDVRFKINADELKRESKRASEAISGVGSKTNTTLVTTSRTFGTAVSSMTRNARSVTAAIHEIPAEVASINRSVRTLSQGAMAYFGIALAKDIISVTGEFQKYNAVLTNSLGSSFAAAQGMGLIQEFVAKTPFQVNEVTSSFVKLVNQGFEPTYAQMVLLGDVASSTGKSFDQLTEALLDAQTGEFERLKEFGIKARNQGDTIKFTFKGIETQVYNTASSIRDYILSLGSIKGVAGSNAKISATIEGQLSNLEDKFTALKKSLGDGNKGIVSGYIDMANTLIDNAQEIIDVLKVLVVAYGSYKAAVIATYAAQRAGLILKEAQAFVALARAVRSARDAQVLLNVATKSNLIGVAVSALATIISALVVFRSRTDDASQGVETLNDSISEAKKEYDSLMGVVRDETKGITARQAALEKLRDMYPSLFAQMDIEAVKTANQTELDAEAARIALLKRRAEIASNVVDAGREVSREDAALEAPFRDSRSRSAHEENRSSAISRYEVEKAALEEINNLIAEQDRLRTKAENEYATRSRSKDKSVGWYDKQIKGFKESQDKATTSDEYQVLQQQIDAMQRAKEEITGAEKKSDAVAKNTLQDLSDDILSITLDTEASRVRAMSDGRKKRLAEIDLEEKQSIAAIDKSQNELAARYKEAKKGALPKEVVAQFDDRRANANKIATNARIKEEEEYNNKVKELYSDLSDVMLSEEDRRIKGIDDKYEELRKRISSAVDNGSISKEEGENLIAQTDSAERKDKLSEALDKYRTYEEEVKSITERCNADITRLKEAGYNEQAELAAKARDKEIQALAAQAVASGDFWAKLIADHTNQSISEMETLTNKALAIYNYLQGVSGELPEGVDAGTLDKIKQDPRQLEAFKNAYENMKASLGDKSPFSAFKVSVNEAFSTLENSFGKGGKGMEGVSVGIGQLRGAFETFAPSLKALGESLDSIFGSNLGELVGQLMEVGGAAGQVFEGVSQMATGNIIAGAMGAIQGIGKLFSKAREAEERHQKALKEIYKSRIEMQRQYNNLLLEEMLLYKEGFNPFGEDKIGKAANNLLVYRKAIEDYNKTLQGDDAKRKYTSVFSSLLDGYLNPNKYNEALDKGVAALASASVVTGHKKTGLFGWGKGRDVYSSLLEVYPDLIDGENKLNKARAESIISTQKLGEGTKELLQSLIDSQDKAEEALEQLDSYIQDTFGAMGPGVMDALVGSIHSGSDAWLEFGSTAADVLGDVGEQLAYTLFFKDKFEALDEQLKGIVGSGKSEEEITQEAIKTVGDFYAGMKDTVSNSKEFLQKIDEQIKDVTGEYAYDSNRGGSAGKLSAELSEGTASEVLGVFSITSMDVRSIRDRSAEISSRTETIGTDVSQIMRSSILIEQHTRNTAANTAESLKELSRGFKETNSRLDDIVRNTKNSSSRM